MSPSWTTSLTPIREHYEKCLEDYGTSPNGVGWKDNDAHFSRLVALLNLIEKPDGYSINDWGCGYGKLRQFLPHTVTYYGYDISPKMLDSCFTEENTNYILSDHPTKIADYTVASGLFNVKGKGEWEEYVIQCIWKMYEMSRKGFGFNMLHSRADKKREDLFYSNPKWVLDKLPSGLRVSVLQYYSPWDFTILCHKEQR